MTVHQRRLKLIQLTIGGNSFECQLSSWKFDPGSKDGARVYTYCTDTANNSFIEETDDEPTLNLKFFSDWRSAGISDFLWQNNLNVVSVVIDHHPDIVGEHVQWSGNVLIKAAPVGGDARTTELTEITLQVVGTLGQGYTYNRIG